VLLSFVGVRKVIRHRHEDVEIVFIVQEDGGLPLFELDANTMSKEDWQQLVLSCFEGLAYLHSRGIAHLDM
jgi:sporulation-control protein spo0M